MLLRGIRAQLFTSLATLVLAIVVSAGSVGVVGAARVGHAPAAVAAMLALYGVVALAEQVARSIVARSHDVALARLRGLTGRGLIGFAAGPLLAVTLVGITAGSLLGVEIATRIADGWHTSYSLQTREVVVALALLAGAWATVALVAAAVIRRPLVEALSVSPRRHPASWITTFLEILVVAAAVLAVYEAHRGGHGWVPVIAPALVALAAGQVVCWLLTLTPRLGPDLGIALTTRRLRRDPAPGSVVRILVAAAVLLAVTLTGGRAASSWRDDAAHLRAGGPVVVPFTGGALRAYAAAHDADPDGRWLMAAVPVGDLRATHRRVYVDSDRWPAVVGDFVAGSSAAAATAQMPTLADQSDLAMLRGSALRVLSSGLTAAHPATVIVRYLGDAGYPRTIRLALTGGGWSTRPLPACRVGCSLISVTVRGSAPFDVEKVVAGKTSLLTSPASYSGHGLTSLVTVADGAPQKTLTTPGLDLGSTEDGIDGSTPRIAVDGTVDAVTFLGRYGSFLDLSRALRGSVGSVSAAAAVVVARADTPTAVLSGLRHDGGGAPTTYADVTAAFDATSATRADRLAFLVALGIGLIALTHLVSWLAGQVGRRRAEVAGLRTAGVPPSVVRRAYVVEAAVLATVVLVSAGVAAAATTETLLQPMKLVGGWADAPMVDLGLRPLTLALVVVGVTILTVLACIMAFTRFGRAARPSALRGTDR